MDEWVDGLERQDIYAPSNCTTSSLKAVVVVVVVELFLSFFIFVELVERKRKTLLAGDRIQETAVERTGGEFLPLFSVITVSLSSTEEKYIFIQLCPPKRVSSSPADPAEILDSDE